MHNITIIQTKKAYIPAYLFWGFIIIFCLFLMSVYCKEEYKLLAVTDLILEVLLGSQWEVPEQLSTKHTHRSLQVLIILHVACTFQQVCGVGHSCFVTVRAVQVAQ